jgi:hypothetical protein
MTYQKIKEAVVEEQKRLTNKKLRVFVIKLALSFLCLSFALCLATSQILSFQFTILIMFLALFAFSTTLNMFVEDEASGKRIMRFANFWWIWLIVTVIIYLVLKYFRFL